MMEVFLLAKSLSETNSEYIKSATTKTSVAALKTVNKIGMMTKTCGIVRQLPSALQSAREAGSLEAVSSVEAWPLLRPFIMHPKAVSAAVSVGNATRCRSCPRLGRSRFARATLPSARDRPTPDAGAARWKIHSRRDAGPRLKAAGAAFKIDVLVLERSSQPLADLLAKKSRSTVSCPI
ncbi:MAG: hypothetical protein L0Y70_00685 [Gemmataceae bacterium]|nr:hypothetical protein [Gemmataceae bacterium]